MLRGRGVPRPSDSGMLEATDPERDTCFFVGVLLMEGWRDTGRTLVHDPVFAALVEDSGREGDGVGVVASIRARFTRYEDGACGSEDVRCVTAITIRSACST